MKCYVFVYGTLCDAKVQKQVLGYEPSSSHNAITGFRLERIELDNIHYPIMVQYPLSETRISGLCLEINDDDLLLLDDYETSAYRRIRVKLADGFRAWMYCK